VAQTWLGQGALTRVLTGGLAGVLAGVLTGVLTGVLYGAQYSQGAHGVLTGYSQVRRRAFGWRRLACEGRCAHSSSRSEQKETRLQENKQPTKQTNKQTPFAVVWVSSQSASAGDALQPTNVAPVATCCMHCVAHCVATCFSALRVRVVQRRTPAAASARAGNCRPITLAQISQPREMSLT
jgi:hypothetical protein